MVLNFQKKLTEALQEIQHSGEAQKFPLSPEQKKRTLKNSDELISRYAEAKEKIVELLNKEYAEERKPFALENWLLKKEEDEVAYFLNEAGANVLFHSAQKIPAQFQLWLGKRGFVIGIEQQGGGFHVEKALQKAALLQQKNRGGRGFAFFQKCKATVFFDDAKEARIVFMEGDL